MSHPAPRTTKARDPRAVARRALFIIIPLALALNYWLQRPAEPGVQLPELRFSVPPDWRYLSRTGLTPQQGVLTVSPDALAEALGRGLTSPLFAVVKYERAVQGLNPMIGVNLALESGATPPDPRVILERSVAEVQASSDNGLRLLGDYEKLTISGNPAARLLMTAAQELMEGQRRDILTVTVIVIGNVSILITGSGASEGEDDISVPLERFLRALEATLN